MWPGWFWLVGGTNCQGAGQRYAALSRAAVRPGCLREANRRFSCFPDAPRASLTAVLGVFPADQPETAYKDSNHSCRGAQDEPRDKHNCRRLRAHLVAA